MKRLRSWALGMIRWLEDRSGLWKTIRPVLEHPVPPQLLGRAGWLYVLGTAVLTVFILQIITGVALATTYVPSAENAYESLQFITQQATWGRLLRGMHFIGASAMVILVALHMARVVLTGSYKFPRELSWLTGVVLLALVFLMAFTGQLQRWDQDAIGSVLVGAEQLARVPIIGSALAEFFLAGEYIGGATLSRFYAYHVFILPALIILVIGVHLYLVLHNGISEPPRADEPVQPSRYRQWYQSMLNREGIAYFPYVIWREGVVAVGVVIVIVALAVLIGPRPLGDPPDPAATQVTPRPDWYLLWIYALLALVPYAAENWVIVLGPLLVGALLIALPFVFNRGERSPLRRPWAPAILAAAGLAIGAFWYIGRVAPWSPAFDTQPLATDAIAGSERPEVVNGAQLFYARGCQFCHTVHGAGGRRGPNLTDVSTRLTEPDITARILVGAANMPAYANILPADEVRAIVAFLEAQGDAGQGQ